MVEGAEEAFCGQVVALHQVLLLPLLLALAVAVRRDCPARVRAVSESEGCVLRVRI